MFSVPLERVYMAEPWLSQYKNELVTMRRDQRMTYSAIIALMEQKYGRKIPQATLSVYFKSLPELQQLPPPGEPRVSPEEEQFLAQREVFEALQRTIDELQNTLVAVHARMGTLEDASAARHRELTGTLQVSAARHTEAPHVPGLEAVQQSLKDLESTVGNLTVRVVDPSVVRRIWKRAIIITSLFWVLMLATALYVVWPRLMAVSTPQNMSVPQRR